MMIAGLLLNMVGVVLIAFAALRVHHHVLNEHKIDEDVRRTMKSEQVLGIIGVVLVVVGHVIQIIN